MKELFMTHIVHVFTSAARNYAPKVILLLNSLRQHHPEWRLHWVVPDDIEGLQVALGGLPVTLWSMGDLGIDAWRRWAFGHTIVELATAVKPFVLEKLLQRADCDIAIYFDPDILVYSRLDDLVQRLQYASVILTPHQTRPESSLSAVIDNEICSLKHGIYNLGFIGVRADPRGRAFAQWWRERVRHFCVDDIPNGLFTDQRWIDLAPALFEGVDIVRDSRFNVSTWNLTTRQLRVNDPGHIEVDGQPLGFYHFTGFDSGAHRVMAAKNAAGNAAVKDLIDRYAAALQRLRDSLPVMQPWAFAKFSDGTPIESQQRRVYRARADLQQAFADPFDAQQFLAWWRRQGPLEYPEYFAPKAASTGGAEPVRPFLAPHGGNRVSLRTVLGLALRDPASAGTLLRRAWDVWRVEGFVGVKRRLGW